MARRHSSSSLLPLLLLLLIQTLNVPQTSSYSIPRLLKYSRSSSKGSLTYCVTTIERSLESYLPYSNYKPSVVPDYEQLLDIYLRAATRLIKHKSKEEKENERGPRADEQPSPSRPLNVPYSYECAVLMDGLCRGQTLCSFVR